MCVESGDCVCVRSAQAYILFRAELAAPFTFSAGTESLEVALFEPDNIPFDEVCIILAVLVTAAAARCLFWHRQAFDLCSDPVDATCFLQTKPRPPAHSGVGLAHPGEWSVCRMSSAVHLQPVPVHWSAHLCPFQVS